MRSDLLRGAGFMLLASAAFAAMGTLVRAVTDEVPPIEVVVWRSGVTALFVGLWAARSGVSLRPINPTMHLVRGIVGVCSMISYFSAIDRLPLGDAVLITYSSPLLVGVMSAYVTGERPSRRTWGALLLGMAGLALVVGPISGEDPVGVGLALLAAFFAADAYLAIRVLTRTDHPLTIVFWFSVIGALGGTIGFVDGAAPLGGRALLELLAIGGTGTLAQWALTEAYASAPAAQVAVFSYATPVLAYLSGAALLGEIPAWTSALGAAVVCLAGWVAAGAVSRQRYR